MKHRVKLTESDLHRIVKESVKKISENIKRLLNENSYYGNGESFPIDPSDLAWQLYNSDCDFYTFVHRLEKTYEMFKDEKNAGSEKDFLNIGKISDHTAFYISIDEETPPQELDVLAKIGNKYQQNIEYDGETCFYVYDKDTLYNFIKDIKSLGLGKQVYVYKGEEPDYEWKFIGNITI